MNAFKKHNLFPNAVVQCILSILLLLSINVGTANAQIAVISNTSEEANELSFKELQRIYNGSITSFSPVLVQRQLSTQFFKAVLKKSDRAVQQIWVKLLLSGRVSQGPVGFSSDAEVIDYIRKNPGAIGFISLDNVTEDVKVLLIDGASPDDMDYPFPS